MAALTVFLTNTNDTLLSTARQLTSTAPSSETNVATTNISKTCVESNKPWQEIFAQGGSGGTSASEPTPSGNGFLWDVTTLEGQQIAAGNWTPSIKLMMNFTFTADIYCRVWVRHSNGTFSQIGGDMFLSAQTLTANSATVFNFSATGLSAQNFVTGDKLYVDWLLHFTGDPGTSGTASVTLFENGGANEQVVTPGFAPSGSLSPGTGDAYYDYLDVGIKVNRPRGLPWHPYYLGAFSEPPEIFQVGTGLPAFAIAYAPGPEALPRPTARIRFYHVASEKILPDEQTVPVLAPAILIPEFPTPLFLRTAARPRMEPGQHSLPPFAFTPRSGWNLLPPPTVNAPTVSAGGSLATNTQFFYVVTTITSAGESTRSNEVNATTTLTNLTIGLTWGSVFGATGYRVYRGTAGGSENILLAQVSGTTYSDAGTASLGSQTPPSINTAGTGTDWGPEHLSWLTQPAVIQSAQPRKQIVEHNQQALIIGGPDPVSFAPLAWDGQNQINRQLPKPALGALVTDLPHVADVTSDAVIRLGWLERSTTSPRPTQQAPREMPSPAVVPLPQPQETLTGGELFPQPATLVRQPLDRKELSTTWERPPIVDAGPLGWLHTTPPGGVGQARSQNVQANLAGTQTDLPSTLVQLTTPFPWLQEQQPTALPWKMPRPATQFTGLQSEVSPQANFLIVVNGPYFVVAAQLYCPGAVAGDVTTE